MKYSGKKPSTSEPQQPAEAIENYVSWFEIPAIDINRSVNFYNKIYGLKMEITEVNNYTMALFPVTSGIGGAIVSGEGSLPSDTGTLVYLNAGKNLNTVLSKIEDAGGRVILPKTLINKTVGYFALFLDTEGNKLALHSKT